jgi:hypothetical protein
MSPQHRFPWGLSASSRPSLRRPGGRLNWLFELLCVLLVLQGQPPPGGDATHFSFFWQRSGTSHTAFFVLCRRRRRTDGSAFLPSTVPSWLDCLQTRPDFLQPRSDFLPPKSDFLQPRPDFLQPRSDFVPPRSDTRFMSLPLVI